MLQDYGSHVKDLGCEWGNDEHIEWGERQLDRDIRHYLQLSLLGALVNSSKIVENNNCSEEQ